MSEYAPGVPLWVDLCSTDLDQSKAFYTALFGWKALTLDDPQAGGYTMFYLNDKKVAAVGPMFAPGSQPVWSTYVCSTDADATATAINDAGGQVLMGPDDVMGQGRMVAAVDPTGAHIMVWQPELHRGAEVTNEPGAFCWNELYTRDLPADREFYRAVFGWDAEESNQGAQPYTVFQAGGQSVAGGMDMSTMLPETVPPHWLVYFAVADTSATLDRVRELGGTVIDGPIESPMGPIGILQDPVGAHFAVIQVAAA